MPLARLLLNMHGPVAPDGRMLLCVITTSARAVVGFLFKGDVLIDLCGAGTGLKEGGGGRTEGGGGGGEFKL